MRLLRAVLFSIVVSTQLLAQSATDKPEIPAGVNYRVASDDVNARAKTLLEKVLAGNKVAWNEFFSGGPVTCGPMLWQSLKPDATPPMLNAKPVTMVLTNPTAITTEGRAFNTDEE